ncbi:LacI family DNA-binding transcriptional regulator [Acetobacter oeni]|uniref:Cytochrome-c peroxidase n=1 Tax=Acetobacter oeni TaxID=304077 RepID=A0A511XQH4_9PROT|nr:LacI family DNA-binding transcriptional regulator [Acetobacter oeni]NHO20776.1 substrate-binding domain-containing protein [Acetobacter oeni]GBR10052.1 LacI family transcriptional regulator [Acetobacter oeni LMG 21952]GEN65211.1 cytochrome-c peroxidase [Acetobacter oeni]
MKKKGPTIQDVANRAGLSKAAVSRYLNKSINLPEETGRKIDEAVKALGYRRNSIARRLSKGGSETIGLVVPEISNPFFSEMAEAVEQTASERGYNLILGISRNHPDKEIGFLRWIDDSIVDGLLFVTNRPGNRRLQLDIRRYRSVVLLDEDIPGTVQDKVFCQNVEGARDAVRYLIRTGHRRIFHVTGPVSLMSVKERLDGFRLAHEEAGLPCSDNHIFHHDYSQQFGRDVVRDILSRPALPDAVFAASDYIAIGMLEELKRNGVRVPDDMSIVGFDDTTLAGLVTPKLTTIRQSAAEMGRIGATRLLDALAQPGVLRGVTRIAASLVVRDSVLDRRE